MNVESIEFGVSSIGGVLALGRVGTASRHRVAGWRTEWRTALRAEWRAELKKPRHLGLPPATRNKWMTESMADDRWLNE
jgi:hypothetical protein